MVVFDDILGGGYWVTGLAIGVGAVIILPLAAPNSATFREGCDQRRRSGVPGRG